MAAVIVVMAQWRQVEEVRVNLARTSRQQLRICLKNPEAQQVKDSAKCGAYPALWSTVVLCGTVRQGS